MDGFWEAYQNNNPIYWPPLCIETRNMTLVNFSDNTQNRIK